MVVKYRDVWGKERPKIAVPMAVHKAELVAVW